MLPAPSRVSTSAEYVLHPRGSNPLSSRVVDAAERVRVLYDPSLKSAYFELAGGVGGNASLSLSVPVRAPGARAVTAVAIQIRLPVGPVPSAPELSLSHASVSVTVDVGGDAVGGAPLVRRVVLSTGFRTARSTGLHAQLPLRAPRGVWTTLVIDVRTHVGACWAGAVPVAVLGVDARGTMDVRAIALLDGEDVGGDIERDALPDAVRFHPGSKARKFDCPMLSGIAEWVEAAAVAAAADSPAPEPRKKLPPVPRRVVIRGGSPVVGDGSGDGGACDAIASAFTSVPASVAATTLFASRVVTPVSSCSFNHPVEVVHAAAAVEYDDDGASAPGGYDDDGASAPGGGTPGDRAGHTGVYVSSLHPMPPSSPSGLMSSSPLKSLAARAASRRSLVFSALANPSRAAALAAAVAASPAASALFLSATSANGAAEGSRLPVLRAYAHPASPEKDGGPASASAYLNAVPFFDDASYDDGSSAAEMNVTEQYQQCTDATATTAAATEEMNTLAAAAAASSFINEALALDGAFGVATAVPPPTRPLHGTITARALTQPSPSAATPSPRRAPAPQQADVHRAPSISASISNPWSSRSSGPSTSASMSYRAQGGGGAAAAARETPLPAAQAHPNAPSPSKTVRQQRPSTRPTRTHFNSPTAASLARAVTIRSPRTSARPASPPITPAGGGGAARSSATSAEASVSPPHATRSTPAYADGDAFRTPSRNDAVAATFNATARAVADSETPTARALLFSSFDSGDLDGDVGGGEDAGVQTSFLNISVGGTGGAAGGREHGGGGAIEDEAHSSTATTKTTHLPKEEWAAHHDNKWRELDKGLDAVLNALKAGVSP